MPYVSDFNPPGVGTFVAMLAWLRLALFIAFVSVLIVMTRAAQPNAPPHVVGLIGLLVTAFFNATALFSPKRRTARVIRRRRELIRSLR
jgi:hypothetical protein